MSLCVCLAILIRGCASPHIIKLAAIIPSSGGRVVSCLFTSSFLSFVLYWTELNCWTTLQGDTMPFACRWIPNGFRFLSRTKRDERTYELNKKKKKKKKVTAAATWQRYGKVYDGKRGSAGRGGWERERARDIWGRRGEFKFRKPQSSSSSFEFLEQWQVFFFILFRLVVL